MKQLQKLVLLTVLCVFAFSSVSFAAVSSSKPKMSAPPAKAPTTQTAPTPPSNSNSYSPSAPASSYSDKAPATKAAATSPTVPQQNTTGGFMRNLGMFGGGMMLGSMLGGMFGFGNSGMFASLFGMLINIAIIAGIFMLGRVLWGKLKSRPKNYNDR